MSEKEQEAYEYTYTEIRKAFPRLKIVLATYFERLGNNLDLTVSLPVNVLHVDLVRGESQLTAVISKLKENTMLSLGVVDGRKIWKNDFDQSVATINQAVEKLGKDRVWIAPSCSLIHSPVDLENETNEANLTAEVKQWLAYAKQKVAERVPKREEMVHLLKKAKAVIPGDQLWVNPDCGLKTLGWDETRKH